MDSASLDVVEHRYSGAVRTRLQNRFGVRFIALSVCILTCVLFRRPFGAFVALLYGLTSAPASQPRNAILGQTISLTIAVIFTKYCPFLATWMKQSLGTALAIATMTRLGITHPPAGAAALIFTGDEELGWGNLLFMLVGTVLAILSATFVNNWSDKRQYPSFWIGFR